MSQSLRILLVTEDLPVAHLGGAGKHAVLLGNTLIEAGHQVELLGRQRAPGFDGHNDFNGPLHASIDLRGTGWQEHRFGAYLPFRREHAARRVWQAIQALGPQRFDVIHYHGHLTGLGALVPAALPFVQTLHDQGSDCLAMTRFKNGAPCRETNPRACASCATAKPNALQTWLSAAAARRLRRQSVKSFARHQTVFVSDFLRSRFVANVQPALPLRAQVVHNFTSASRLRQALADAPLHADGKPLLLMVGRVDASKGFADFLDALPDSVLERWQVCVVGEGPLRTQLQVKHEPRGVQFSGLIDQRLAYHFTARADICVVPSVWDEPCGTTILEALSIGRTTLALRRGGTPELQRYERHPGQLVLGDSIAELVTWLVKAAGQPPSAAVASGVADDADVLKRVPELLRVYRHAGQAVSPLPTVGEPHE